MSLKWEEIKKTAKIKLPPEEYKKLLQSYRLYKERKRTGNLKTEDYLFELLDKPRPS